MIRTYPEKDAIEREALLARLLEERGRVLSAVGMHSAGGWHTRFFRLGRDWLGQAMMNRLAQSGITKAGKCWANILPPGSSYEAHAHKGQAKVAVWCLAGNGELQIERWGAVPDRVGQLVTFPGVLRHWVPTVTSERVTVAANLG